MIEPTAGNHTTYDSEEDAQHDDDDDIKMEEPDREAAEAEANRKADLDAKANAQKLISCAKMNKPAKRRKLHDVRKPSAKLKKYASNTSESWQRNVVWIGRRKCKPSQVLWLTSSV